MLAWMNNFNHIMVLYIWDKVNFTLGLKDTVKSRVFREYILSFFRESVVKTFKHEKLSRVVKNYNPKNICKSDW